MKEQQWRKWLLPLIYACLVVVATLPACLGGREHLTRESRHDHNRHLTALQLADRYNASKDDPQQLLTLQQLYKASNGPGWLISQAPSVVPWLTPGSSYCMWLGVSCCLTSPLTLVSCNDSNSVVVLNLAGFGLTGQLPVTPPALPELSVLNLEDNLGLTGGLPDAWLPPTLLWLSTQNTSIVSCLQGPAIPLPGACQLPSTLSWSTQVRSLGSSLQCPTTQLVSFQQQTQGVSQDLAAVITQPYPAQGIPGAVIADATFTNGNGCICAAGGFLSTDQGQLRCDNTGGGGSGKMTTKKWIIVVVLVAVIPHILVAAIAYLYWKHKAYLHRIMRFKEAALQRKRGKVPGTPGLVLQEGRGLVPLADTMVTWVCTDVASSTILWECDASAMDSAIDMHNRAIRDIMYEFGGHEIRNEGDSFVISFHEALDGVFFCLKAQERLQSLAWPTSLLMQAPASTITIGDLIPDGIASGAGHVIMTGLRVRMGINTGMPEDVFLHDLTEHVDYRGQQYDLTAEICDLAKGGQILMGPKTYLSWMRHSADNGQDNFDIAWRDGSQIFGGSAFGRRAVLSTGGSFRTTMLRRQLGVDSGLGSNTPDRAPGSVSHNRQNDSSGEQSWTNHHPQIGNGKVLGSMFPSLSSIRVNTRALVSNPSWASHSPAVASSPTTSPGRHTAGDNVQTQPNSGFDDVSQLQAVFLNADRITRGSHEPGTPGGSAMPSPVARGPHMPAAMGALTRLSLSRGPADWPGQRGEGHLEMQNMAGQQDSPTKGMFHPERHTVMGHGSSAGALGGLEHIPSMARSVGDYGEQQEFGMDRMYAIQQGEGRGLEHLVQQGWRDSQVSQHADTGMMGVCMRCMDCFKNIFHVADENIPWEEQVTTHQTRKQLSTSPTVRGVTIDMGFYEWNANPQKKSSKWQVELEGDAADAPAADQQQGGIMMVHLVQVVPACLASRALLFDWPIELGDNSHWEKVGPGFFDAPGSYTLTFSCLRDIMTAYQIFPERPMVVLTFTSIEGIKELAAVNVMLASATTQMHNACVRETLSACNGYECKESEGAFVLAFKEASSALEWALTLQLALMQLPWSPQLLSSHELFGEVWDAQASTLVFRGARARVGVYSGNVDRVVPHIKTGRADYFGQPVNRAARLMSAAHGGQVVCDQSIVQSVFDEWARKYSAVREAEVQQQMIGPIPFLTAGQLAGVASAGMVKSGTSGLLAGGLAKAVPRILKSSLSSARNQNAAAAATAAVNGEAAASGWAYVRSSSKRTVSFFPQAPNSSAGTVRTSGGEAGAPIHGGAKEVSGRLDAAADLLASEMRVARSFTKGSRLRHTGHSSTSLNAPLGSTAASPRSPRSICIPGQSGMGDSTRLSDPQFHPQTSQGSPHLSPNHPMASEPSWSHKIDTRATHLVNRQRSWHGVRSADVPLSPTNSQSPTKGGATPQPQEANRLLDTPSASTGTAVLPPSPRYALWHQHSKASSSQVAMDIASAEIRLAAWDPDTHTRSGARRMSAGYGPAFSTHASSAVLGPELLGGHGSVTSGRMRSSLVSGPSSPSIASGAGVNSHHAAWAGASNPASPRGTSEWLSGGGASHFISGGGADGGQQPHAPWVARHGAGPRRSSRHATSVAVPITPVDSQDLPSDMRSLGPGGASQEIRPSDEEVHHQVSQLPSMARPQPQPATSYLSLHRDRDSPQSSAHPGTTNTHRNVIPDLNTSRSSHATNQSARSTPGGRNALGHQQRTSRTSRVTNCTNRTSLSSVADMRAGAMYGDMEDGEEGVAQGGVRTTGGGFPDWMPRSAPRKSLLGNSGLRVSTGGTNQRPATAPALEAGNSRHSLTGAGAANISAVGTNCMSNLAALEIASGGADVAASSQLNGGSGGSRSSCKQRLYTQSASQLVVLGTAHAGSWGPMEAGGPIPRLTGVAPMATARTSMATTVHESPLRASMAGAAMRRPAGLLSGGSPNMERSTSAANRLSSRTLEQLGISNTTQVAVMPAGRRTTMGGPIHRVQSMGGLSLEQLIMPDPSGVGAGVVGGEVGSGEAMRRRSHVDRAMQAVRRTSATTQHGSLVDMSRSSLPTTQGENMLVETGISGTSQGRYLNETSFVSNRSSTNTAGRRSSLLGTNQTCLGSVPGRTSSGDAPRVVMLPHHHGTGGGSHVVHMGSGGQHGGEAVSGEHQGEGNLGPVLDGIILSPRGDSSSVRLRLKDGLAILPPIPMTGGAITSPTTARNRSTRGGSRRASSRSVTLSPANTKVGMGTTGGGAEPGSGRDSASGPDASSSAVIAECFKISKSPGHEEGAVMTPPTSITMIKYSVRQQDGGANPEEDLTPVDEDEAMQPRAAKVMPMVPIEVCVWSLGSFRLKGVTELMKVVQLVPRVLEQRIDHLQKGALNKGKARCVQRFMVRMDRTTIPLPDVTKLPCTLGPSAGDGNSLQPRMQPSAPSPFDGMARDNADGGPSLRHDGLGRMGTIGGEEPARPREFRGPPSMAARSSTHLLEFANSGMMGSQGFKSISNQSSLGLGLAGSIGTRENSQLYQDRLALGINDASPRFSGPVAGWQGSGPHLGPVWLLEGTTADETLAPIHEIASPHATGMGNLGSLPSSGLPTSSHNGSAPATGPNSQSAPRLPSQASMKLQEMRPAAIILPTSPSELRLSGAHSSVRPDTNTPPSSALPVLGAAATAAQAGGTAKRPSMQGDSSALGPPVGRSTSGMGLDSSSRVMLAHTYSTVSSQDVGRGNAGIAMDSFFAADVNTQNWGAGPLRVHPILNLPMSDQSSSFLLTPPESVMQVPSAMPSQSALACLSVIPYSAHSQSQSQARASHESQETFTSIRLAALLGIDTPGSNGGGSRSSTRWQTTDGMLVQTLGVGSSDKKTMSKSASQAAAANAATRLGHSGGVAASGSLTAGGGVMEPGRSSDSMVHRLGAHAAWRGPLSQRVAGQSGPMQSLSGTGGLSAQLAMAMVPLHQVRSGTSAVSGSGAVGSSARWPLQELTGTTEEVLENEKQLRVEQWAQDNAMSMAGTPVPSMHQVPSAPGSGRHSNDGGTSSATGVSANLIRVAFAGMDNLDPVETTLDGPGAALELTQDIHAPQTTPQQSASGGVNPQPYVNSAVVIDGGSGRLPASRVLRSSRPSNSTRNTIDIVRQLVAGPGSGTERGSGGAPSLPSMFEQPTVAAVATAGVMPGFETPESGMIVEEDEEGFGPSFRYAVARGPQGQHVAEAVSAALASTSSPKQRDGVPSPSVHAELLEVGPSSGSVTFMVAGGEAASPKN